MKALKALVIGMGVLIVAEIIVVAATIAHRLSSPAPAPTVPGKLTLAAGTEIEAMSTGADRITLLVRQSDGARALLVVDPATGAVIHRVDITTPPRDQP
jgi:hypothetical protein